jgi:glucosamine-phosphate N-acetyltransferase
MSHFVFNSLLELIKEYENVEEIKNNYIDLLSQLTDIEFIANNDFVNQIAEISNIGDTIVCYYIDIETELPCIIAAGTIIYEPKIIHGCKPVGHIEDIVVDVKYRSNGIATKIVKELVHLAKINNCYKVTLDCKTDLIPLYERAGFENYGNQMSIYF